MPKRKTLDFPLQTRLADIQPASINTEARTVELVWSTGATVRRTDWWTGKSYDESLSLDADHVDLSRLNAGAPLLNTHNMYELGSVMGVVEKAWIDGNEGRALVRFSTRDDVEPIWNDVRTGIIRNVSVGYTVRKFEITEEEGKVPLYRAVDWQPHELSLVPVGADAGAGTRGRLPTHPCEIVNRASAQHEESTDMPTNVKTTGAEPVETRTEAAAPPAPDLDAVRREAQSAERTRAADIRKAGSALGIDAAVIDKAIADGVSVDAARAAFIDAHADRAAAHGAVARVVPGEQHDNPEVLARAMAESLTVRYTRRGEPSEAARRFMDYSLTDLASDLLAVRGIKMGKNKAEIIERAMAHTTSDFPLLLAATANKILLSEYNLAQPSYKLVAARKSFKDFKPHGFLRSGDFPNLLQKGESGEFKSGTMSESKETVILAEFGRVIGLSRRALINDDLGAFADLTMKIGRRVAAFENATVWAALVANPTMSDTKTMFHSGHGNLASSGGAIGVDTVSVGRAAMQKQTSLDGLALNLGAKYILTSPDKATAAEQLVSTALLAAQVSNVNVFSGKLIPVSDANLTGNAWYLFADPAEAEALVYGYLEGREGPRVSSQVNFRSDDVEMKVALDFAAGVIDYRPAYKNPGA